MRSMFAAVAMIAALGGCQIETPAPAPSPAPAPVAQSLPDPPSPPVALKAGSWAITRTIEDVRMPAAPPPLATAIRQQMDAAVPRGETRCFTETDPRSALVPVIRSLQQGGQCDAPRLSASGATMIGVMRCRIGDDGARRVTLRGNLTAELVTLATVSRISGPGLPGEIEARIRIDARRTGDCPPPPAREGS